jgi:hypothetical protein
VLWSNGSGISTSNVTDWISLELYRDVLEDGQCGLIGQAAMSLTGSVWNDTEMFWRYLKMGELEGVNISGRSGAAPSNQKTAPDKHKNLCGRALVYSVNESRIHSLSIPL